MNTLESKLYDALGDEWCGGTSPPNSEQTVWFRAKKPGEAEYVASTVNDGFEVMVGFPNEWLIGMSVRRWRKFALWVIWLWVREWFGLRRWLWYKLLSRRVRSYQ